MSAGFECCGCGAPVIGRLQTCGCSTRVAFRRGEGGHESIRMFDDPIVAEYVDKHGMPSDFEDALSLLARAALNARGGA